MARKLYAFEQWTLDRGRGALTGPKGEIALRPKTFEVLRFLVENAGRLTSREEMLEAVWRNVTVAEEALTHCVSEIRQALGDADQRIIKTVPRRGYLLSAAVSKDASGVSDAAVSPPPRPMAPGPSPDVAPPTSPQHAFREPCVAVLPFANLSGDPGQEYLSDGFTEDIINGLSYFSELSVIARNSSFAYKGRAIDVRDVGRKLGAGYLVEGSVRRFGDRIRITAQLIDTSSGIRRWAERFDRTVGEIFAVQDEIAQAIVKTAVAHLGHAERQRVLQSPPTFWTAYDLSLQADEVFRTYRLMWTLDKLYEARRLYAEALKVDPNNATVCAKYAYVLVRGYHEPDDPECGSPSLLKHGYEMAEKAVGLDPNLPLARANLGWALLWMRQHDAAISEYEKALALNPSFSDAQFGGVLVYAGEASRALSFGQEHLRLDPFHPPHLHAIQGHALYQLRRYGEAAAPLRECTRRAPRVLLGQLFLTAALVQLGENDEAAAVAVEIRKQSPRMATHWLRLMPYRNPQDAEHMLQALRACGFA